MKVMITVRKLPLLGFLLALSLLAFTMGTDIQVYGWDWLTLVRFLFYSLLASLLAFYFLIKMVKVERGGP